MKKRIFIEKVVFGAKGLARTEKGIVLIPGVLPGEEVEAQLTESKHFYTGVLKKIISPSPFRIENDCKYENCGGCDLRFCSYRYEIELKKNMLSDVLERIAKLSFPENKIKTLFSRRNEYRIKTGFKSKKGKIGFFGKKSNDIVEIDKCLQAPESTNSKLSELKNKGIKRDFFIESHPFENKTAYYLKGEKGEVFEIKFDNFILLHKTGNFIQANRHLLKQFVKTVCNLAGEGESLLELYAGSGLFTLPLSKQYKKVRAYEHSKSATDMLKKSAVLNGFSNIEIINKPAEVFEPKNYSTAVLDPPREGLGKIVVKKLLDVKPEKIVYISCNASTFARDFKVLKEKYNMKELYLLDNFPATAHFELIALLRRK